MKSFLSRFGSLVLFVLSGFDRLRFCGDSRLLNHAGGVSSFLFQRRILRKDFAAYCEKLLHAQGCEVRIAKRASRVSEAK